MDALADESRPRRQASRRTRAAARKPSRGADGRGKQATRAVDGEGEEEEEEEEEELEELEELEEEEEEPVVEEEDDDPDAHHASTRASFSIEEGALVRIAKTPDVEARLPHTANKVGIVEEVPHHPNTWFRVRIRDGDVVYKYRASALQPLSESDNGSPHPSPVHDASVYGGDGDEEDNASAGDESDAEQKDESGDEGFDDGAHVQIKLAALHRRERPLKKHDGKKGVVTGRSTEGIFVQLEGDDATVITIRPRHLTAAEPSAAETEHEDEGNDGDDDEDAEEPRSKTKGKLLSDLDPEMWIDRKCRINVGKFKGKIGRVLRSGNGWVQLRLINSSENTAKRAYELTLIEDMDTIRALYAKSVENEKKRRAANGGKHDDGDDDDDDDDDDGARSGPDDSAVAEHTDDSQGEESGGKRSRRVSTRGNYGISWIERKVNLPNRRGTGIVKKADRDNCTVELTTSRVLKVFKKKELELIEDESTKNGRQNSRNRNNIKARERLGLADDVMLMGTTPARYVAFQDLVKRFSTRRRERVKKRPNLIEWQARLDLDFLENGERDATDPSVIDLIVVPRCEICGVEKEDPNGECWNLKCPACVTFDVDAYEPNPENIARLPLAPLPGDYITTSLCLKKDETTRKRKRNAGDAGASAKVSTPRGEDVAVDSKQVRKDPNKGKKEATQTDRSSKKAVLVSDKAGKKNVSKAAESATVDQGNEGESAAMEVDSSPTSGFRPQYDSVYSH